MSGGALGQIRRLFGAVNTDAVHLSARLLDAVEVGRDLLAPVAEEATPAGIAAGLAFQILSDAATEAAPPSAITPATGGPASRNGYALLLADALARGRGLELDGTPRRECRPLKP